MNDNLNAKLDRVKLLLDNIRKAHLKKVLLLKLGNMLTITFAIWLTFTLMNAQMILSTPIRMLMLIICLLVPSSLLVYNALLLIQNPIYRRGKSSEFFWAGILGKNAPETVRDRLLNALQVFQSPHKDESDAMASHAMLLAVSDLQNVSTESAFQSSRIDQKTLYPFYMVLTAVAISIIIAPNQMGKALNSILHPNITIEKIVEYGLTVETNVDYAFRNEPVEFQVNVDGNPVREVEFVWRYLNRDLQQLSIPLKDNLALWTSDGFQETIEYALKLHDEQTEFQRLRIVARPEISEFKYEITPPTYSKLSKSTGRINSGDVEALAGTIFKLDLTSTKTLTNSFLIIPRRDEDDYDTLKMEVDGNRAQLKFNIDREIRYAMLLQDTEGNWSKNPVFYRIRLLPDDFPLVRITFPDADVEIGEELLLPLMVEADDDYGISRLNLHYQRLGYEDKTPFNFELPIERNRTSVVTNHLWNLVNIDLMPGDVIEYWARAYDNDNVKGPKYSDSEKRLVRLPSIEDIIANIEQQENVGIEKVENTLEAAKELREQVEKLVEEVRKNPEMDWERKQQLDDALKKQDNIEKNLEQLSQQIDEMIKAMEQHDMVSDETMQKYMELQKLLAEVASPELKEAMDKLREAMENQDPDAVRSALEEFNFDQEAMLENIEKTMNILKQLQLERKLDELVKQVDDLLKQQERINEQMNKADSKKLSEEQNSLINPTEAFEKRIVDVINAAKEAGEDNTAQNLSEIAQDFQTAQVPQNMQEISQSLAQNNINDAEQKSEQTSRQLASTYNELSKTAKDLKEQRKSDLAQKMKRMVEEMLILSKFQEQLLTSSREIGTRSPQYREFSSDQEDLRRALDGITNRIVALSKETFFISPQLGASLGIARESMEKAIVDYTERNPRNVAPSQERSLGEVNRATRQLLEILDQLEGSSSSSGYEEMMEQLAEMASQQQGLNQQSMPMPGASGEQQMPGGDQLSQMAAQQRALEQGMQQLAEKGQGIRDILGDLDEIANQMGDVAQDMEDKNIDERTRRIQRQIVSRLLDATRSMRQQEYSKQRERNLGVDVTRTSPDLLKLETEKDQLRREMLRALQEGYSRDYRTLIRSYFQTLDTEENKPKP